MAAAEGNRYSAMFDDNPEALKDAYKTYCDHLAKGKHKKSWFYDKNGYKCTWFTMERYISESKAIDSINKEIALSKGYQIWEEICEESATGKNKKANTASLQMVMRNKFGWDKEDKDSAEATPEKSSLSAWNEFIKSRQSSALNNAETSNNTESKS